MTDNSISPFEELAQEYDRWFDGEGKLIFSIEAEAFRSVLPYLAGPKLEIGTGSGRFAQELGIENGVEPSGKLAAKARSRGISVYQGNGEEMPFSCFSYGTVFIILTLCFLSAPLKVLQEAYRILVPSGKLALGTILKDSPWGQYYLQKKAAGHRFYGNACFYSYGEIERMLQQAGFSIQQSISTLYQVPGKVTCSETPHPGIDTQAGFSVIIAVKNDDSPKRS